MVMEKTTKKPTQQPIPCRWHFGDADEYERGLQAIRAAAAVNQAGRAMAETIRKAH